MEIELEIINTFTEERNTLVVSWDTIPRKGESIIFPSNISMNLGYYYLSCKVDDIEYIIGEYGDIAKTKIRLLIETYKRIKT